MDRGACGLQSIGSHKVGHKLARAHAQPKWLWLYDDPQLDVFSCENAHNLSVRRKKFSFTLLCSSGRSKNETDLKQINKRKSNKSLII